jgi:hypothetical protein
VKKSERAEDSHQRPARDPAEDEQQKAQLTRSRASDQISEVSIGKDGVFMGMLGVIGAFAVGWPGVARADEFSVNCRSSSFQARTSLRGLLSWGKTYKKKVLENQKLGRYSARACKKAVSDYGKAHCKAPRDRGVAA